MRKAFIEKLEKFNKASIEAIQRLGEINSRTIHRIGAVQLQAASDYLAGGVRQLELLGDLKHVQDAASGEARLFADLNEKTIGHTRRSAEILGEARDSLIGWIEESAKSIGAFSVGKTAGKKAA